MSEEILSAEDISRIRVEWRVEAEDRMEAAKSVLSRMHSQAANESLMKELMRALHSLKGTAAMVGFRDISEFTHLVEEYCDLFRGQKALPLSQLSLDLLDIALTQLSVAVDSMTPERDPSMTAHRVTEDLQAAINQMQREPDLPSAPTELGHWPETKAADQISSMTAICQSCPFVTSGWASLPRKIIDPQDFKNQLALLNSLAIEPCILVVDDEPDVTLVVSDLIKSILPRARLIEVDSGHKALQLLKSVMGDQIDLVVTDLVMPDTSGLDVLRLIIQLKERGELFANAIVMTAYKPEEKDWKECLQFGVRDFLVKPFGVSELLNSLLPPIREAMMNRQLASIVGYSQRVYLGFNRLEREADEQVQIGIRREVHNLILLMNKAQKNLLNTQVLPFS